MLDRAQVVRKLEDVAHEIFYDNMAAYDHIKALWNRLCSDLYAEQKMSLMTSAALPSWHGKLDATYDVDSGRTRYQVIAIDGSQIYPDRHCGFSCYLINIGHVVLRYGIAEKKSAELYSIPYVFSGYDNQDGFEPSNELVNCKRQELEFQHGALCASRECENSTMDAVQKVEDKALLLFDGALIFWNLEAADINFKEAFFPKYIRCLRDLYEKQIPVASYISLPKSRELVQVLRAYAEHCGVKDEATMQALDRLTDGSLVRFYLARGQRTNIFESKVRINSQYPDMLRTCFFYLHVGNEVARVEVPTWIARDEMLVQYVATVVYDQCSKGAGYPVSLAEAHEQAVVKGADRDFFYYALAKMGMSRNRAVVVSQKSYKKQCVGV